MMIISSPLPSHRGQSASGKNAVVSTMAERTSVPATRKVIPRPEGRYTHITWVLLFPEFPLYILDGAGPCPELQFDRLAFMDIHLSVMPPTDC